MNSANEQFESILDENEKGDLINPCLPIGYSRESIVRQDKKMVGASDFYSCQKTILTMFNKTCTHSSCAFNDVFQPPLTGNFVARGSNVESTCKFLELDFEKTSPNLFLSHALSLCSLNLEQYEDQYNSLPQNFCFQSIYIASIWNYGFGFGIDQLVPVKEKINGVFFFIFLFFFF